MFVQDIKFMPKTILPNLGHNFDLTSDMWQFQVEDNLWCVAINPYNRWLICWRERDNKLYPPNAILSLDSYPIYNARVMTIIKRLSEKGFESFK